MSCRGMVAGVTMAGALLAAPCLQAQTFEGSITMRMGSRGPQGAMSQVVEYLVRGGKMRVTMGGPMGGAAMIVSPTEKKLYMLLAAQNSYMEMSLPDSAADRARTAAAGADSVTVTRTGRREQVAGLTCEHVLVSSRGAATDLCLTRELGRFVNPMASLQGGALAPWQRQLGAEFPLKVTMADGSVPLEVTKVERKRLSNDLFAVPNSYTKVTMPPRRSPG
ncbi:DUF4412 domain-containing protein [Gemmatimonas sp.]|jgi:hypothetical protein|uniref:DUF4412 domain-containing protein n=2 Tax=Gemmatimonas sp. TaxID=1962908 RepID=UPI0025B81AEB|nr:DUF4412 domain-containing protein [Gemmatimonas sp.]